MIVRHFVTRLRAESVGRFGTGMHTNTWGVSGHVPLPNRWNALFSTTSLRRHDCV